MFELIEHQKRFQLDDDEDEGLLKWLTKVDEKKQALRKKKEAEKALAWED